MEVSATLGPSEEPGSVPAVSGVWTWQELGIEDVRWYYLRPPLSLKAVYAQDIIHRADLRRLCPTDSNKLELLFREEAEEIEKAWWEEHVGVGGAVSMPLPSGSKSDMDLPDKESSSTSWQEYHLGADSDAGILVRGGLYEAHLRHRRLDTCYWPEPARRLVRGSWFIEKAPDWVPLKEATADELEEAYRSQVWISRGSTLTSPKASAVQQGARVDLQTLQNEAKGWFALFISAEEAYLCKDDYTSWISRKLSSKASAPGYRLRRGYVTPPEGVTVKEADPKAEAADEAAAQHPVTKLLLVVHGIGQNLAAANIAEDAAYIRQGLMANIAEQGTAADQKGRTEVLPVQWRKHLDLDVDKIAQSLMPPGIKSLRTILHATAVEVLLYVTPLHCQEMLDSVVASLNLQYTRFMKRNPDFKGEVSILAHSLGSVLCYDLLCNQPFSSDHSPKSAEDRFGTDENGSSSLPHSAFGARQEFGSLQPLSSSDLDPNRTPQGNASGLDTFFTETARGGSHPDHRLEPSPKPEIPPFAANKEQSELIECRKEIVRLKREIQELRQKQTASLRSSASPQQPMLSPSVAIDQLVFTVDRFIAIGSPLGIFLTLRKVNPHKGMGLGSQGAAGLMVGRGAKQGDGLPACQRMYNLYHPFDPVGFRLEPLIMAGAEKRRPVFASTRGGSRTIGVGLTELGEDMSAAMSFTAAKASSIFKSSLSTLRLTSKRPEASPASPTEEADSEDRKLTEKEEAAEVGVQAASRACDSLIWRLTDGPGDAASYPPSRSAAGRLDFVLQSGITESQWLGAMSSHFAYWTSPDVALFIVRALHHHDVRVGAKSLAKDPAKAAGQSSGAGSPEDPKAQKSLPHGKTLTKIQESKSNNVLSSLSLPSSPPAGGCLSPGALSPKSNVSAKSTSTLRGKGDPADWW